MDRITHKSKFLLCLAICCVFFFSINQYFYYEQWHYRPSSYFSYTDHVTQKPIAIANVANKEEDFGFVEGWEPNVTRDPTLYINPTNITTILKPKDFCDNPSFLLILVCSAPVNFEARLAIRETWGQDKNVSGRAVNTFFLMGETNNATLQQLINEESDHYNDIIQEKFFDSYNNLTLKSLMLLKLIDTNCMNTVKFVMKTDDDMYVNLNPLINTLNQKIKNRNLIIGSLHCRVRPIRDTTNKWFSPKYLFSDKIYPPYLSGTGYVMAVDLASRLFRQAMTMSIPILHLEDVYVTGIVLKSLGLSPRGDPGFSFYTRKVDFCSFQNAYTSHRVPPGDLHKIYDLLKSINKVDCKVENASDESSSALNRIINFFSKNKEKKLQKTICR